MFQVYPVLLDKPIRNDEGFESFKAAAGGTGIDTKPGVSEAQIAAFYNKAA
jgi:hypothetical protein